MNTTDRELLERAAKAAGFHFHGHRRYYANVYVSTTGDTDDWFVWSPLTDDGDALRLAVKLGMNILVHLDDVTVTKHLGTYKQRAWGVDERYAAARRAIVRAAAAIGETK